MKTCPCGHRIGECESSWRDANGVSHCNGCYNNLGRPNKQTFSDPVAEGRGLNAYQQARRAA